MRNSTAGDATWRETRPVAAATGLAGVQEALSALRGLTSLAAVLERGAVEACACLDFDRCVVFRVQDRAIVPVAGYAARNQQDLDAWIADSTPAQLEHTAIETEMLRRRRAVLVTDAQHHPRTLPALMSAGQSSSYVGAPIIPDASVLGLVLADRYFSRRSVSDADRAALWAFTEGFGYALERAIYAERLREQRAELQELLAGAARVGDAHAAAPLTLDVSARSDAPPRRAPDVGPVLGTLTRRERDVLELMAAGATNDEIANRLVVTVGTVKTHVKHVLRKLPAANRAQAVSLYLTQDVERAAPR